MTKECWTALEMQDEFTRIMKMIGPNAEVYTSVSVHNHASADKLPAYVSVYPTGMCSSNKDQKSFRAKTFGEAFALAEKFASTASEIAAATVIRRMALAIIDITDRLGACSDLTLKAEKFSAGEIASYHIEACDAASRMSGNSPFVVTMSVGSIAA